MKKNYKNIIPKLSNKIDFNLLNKNEFILSNITHRHYLKINRETYEILSLIDGIKSLKKICSDYNLNHEASITIYDLEKLLFEKLTIYGVLEGFDDKIKKYQKPSYLKLSFMIINKKMLSKIVRHFYFLFNRKIALFTIILSIGIISSLFLFNIEFYRSFNLQKSIIYFVTTMALSVTFHEIGHATAASFFGAKHGGIGGGFYLFTPVYYADVTDVWMLKKWQRIVVNLSGMYFELIFCSILSLISFFMSNYILLIISITVCFQTLFNLYPFLRSDGYWLLSDLTNKPNLLHNSFEKVKDLFRFLGGKKVVWKSIDFFLFFYGTISYGSIVILLYYVLFKNPNSILKFPKNLIEFITNIFNNSSEINIEKYGELFVPFIFYILLFSLLKSGIKKTIEFIRLKTNFFKKIIS